MRDNGSTEPIPRRSRFEEIDAGGPYNRVKGTDRLCGGHLTGLHQLYEGLSRNAQEEVNLSLGGDM